jgi:RNA polymerase sigma factor (sigma-70 family)
MADGKLGSVLHYIRRWAAGPGGTGPTDGQLLDRFVAHRDEEAFGVLLERHGRLVFNVCRRILHDSHNAEDAFQATFLVLAQKANSIRRLDSVASWLYGVAYRISVRAKARAQKRSDQERQAVGMEPASPESEAAWRELRPLLDAELDQLPEKYRAPLVLCYFEGLSNEEAAEQLQWPSGTVKGRLARARDLLRERLARRGLTLSAAALTALLGEQAMAAPLPAALVDGTLKATALVVAGNALTAGAVSAEVIALSQGALHSMVVTKLKMAALLAAVVALTIGASVSVYQAWAGRPENTGSGQLVAAEEQAKEIKFETIAKAPIGGPAKAEQKVVTSEKDFEALWKEYRGGLRAVPIRPVPAPGVPLPGQPGGNPQGGAGGNAPAVPKVVPGGNAMPGQGGAGGNANPVPVAPKAAPGGNPGQGGAGGNPVPVAPPQVAPGGNPMPGQAGGAAGAPIQLVPGAGNAVAPPPAPKVDFDKQIVVAVAMGSGGVGRSIEITRVEQTKAGVKVYYKEQLPDPNKPRPAIAMTTGPYHIVKLDKPTGEVKFVKEEAKDAAK